MAIERDNYLSTIEVLDMHRVLLRMVKFELITSARALEIMIQDLKLETLGYKWQYVVGKGSEYREHWKLPTGDIITMDRQFNSEIWVDINLIR
tara:strand:+ start:4821 stop:5099 length:279 start_codon:yes stop_codon:yes gene_type:complete